MAKIAGGHMETVNATEIKNRLGRFLQIVMVRPVLIEKNNQPCAVLLSHEEYERLKSIEDAHWASKAIEAEAEGYLGEKESLKIIKKAKRVKT